MPRKSKQRGIILRVLKRARTHLTATEIYDAERNDLPNISLGTVYRNLKIMGQRGDIDVLNFDGSLARFGNNSYPHAHFKCDECDAIFDVEDPIIDEVYKELERTEGHSIFTHQLQFTGLCQNCKSKILGRS